jgi:hypothetical protein
MLDTCMATVLGLMNSASAIWRSVRPSAISVSTSRSRGVRPSSWFARRCAGRLAWGDNESGQLGRGITTPTGGPAPVTGLASVTQVSAGWQSSYAVHTVPFLVGL